MRRFLLLITALLFSSCPGQTHANIVVDEDQLLIGSEVTAPRVENHGVIRSAGADRFVFGPQTLVTGSGYFENTLSLGVFAPGNSPGITTGKNQAYAGTVEIELGGTTPGFGSGRHDQINDDGTITLDAGTSVLSVLSFESYVPSPGDEFTILTWTDGLDGSFSDMIVDPEFTSNYISFVQIITGAGGAGNLTLRAIAIPEAQAAVVWLMLSTIAVLRRNKPLHS